MKKENADVVGCLCFAAIVLLLLWIVVSIIFVVPYKRQCRFDRRYHQGCDVHDAYTFYVNQSTGGKYSHTRHVWGFVDHEVTESEAKELSRKTGVAIQAGWIALHNSGDGTTEYIRKEDISSFSPDPEGRVICTKHRDRHVVEYIPTL